MGSTRKALVADVPRESRYELRLGGQLVGFLKYRPLDGARALVHTEIDERHEGQGFGTRLVLGAFDDLRRRGLAVVPVCPFVAYQIEQHPDYRDLLARG